MSEQLEARVAFANDPMYDEAMQLGKKYRDSLCLEDDESERRKFPKATMSPVSYDALSPKDSKAHKG